MIPSANQPALRWLLLLILGALWLVLWRHLSAHWSSNAQYGYGWLVPPLGIYLLARRWSTRPPPDGRGGRSRAAVVAFAVLFAPTWLVAQPNPDWRVISWLLALEVGMLTAAIFGAQGGRKWERHFTFPALFSLTAVPWPSGIESSVIQGLMRFVASVTVEILNLIHIPALQHGNVIEIGSGLLGVDEACSGVRSLQATLMASLFIGELYRCGAIRRVILLLAGLFVAVVTNICRTFFLGWSAARNGIGAVDQWHDPAGFAILTICFILVWLLAELLSRDEPAPAMAAPDAAPLMLPPKLVTGLAVWFGVIFAGVELWFQDSRQIGTQWTLSAPAGAQPVVLEPAAVEMLQADHSVASSWRGADGSRWTMFFFEWRPGPSRSRILARMHRPEVCLPAAGLRRIADRGILNVEAQGLTLPFEASQFESASGQPIFVYFCPWQNRPGTSGRSEEFRDSAREASLRAVLRRERNLGQQVAQFVVTGYADPAKADAALQKQLGQLLQRTDQPTVPK